MKQDNFKTIVVFRKYKDGDIIALFPNEIVDHNGNCSSYMHVGQHSAAGYTGVVYGTKPAESREYETLKRELESIGYNLNIKKRWSRK